MALLVQDTFTEATGTPDITAHTPDIGQSWNIVEQDNTAVSLEVMSSTDRVSPTGAGADARIMAAPLPNPGTADVDVEITVGVLPGANNTPFGLFARYLDNSNYYVFNTYRSADTTQPRLLRKSAGVYTTLATGTAGRVAANDRIMLRCVGTTISVHHDTGGGYTQIYSATDTTFQSAGRAGLSVGRHDITTDDINTNWQFDTFIVTDAAAVGAAVVDPFGMSGFFGQ